MKTIGRASFMLRQAFRLSAILMFLGQLNVAAQADKPMEPPLAKDGVEWTRVLTEEFDGTALDRDVWTTCYWWNENGCTNLANKELQWYQPGNVSVSDGILRLEARPETVTGYKGQSFPYTSGMVTTGRDYSELPRPPRYDFQYGLIEVRAKLPAGTGLWPAIWLLPSTLEPKPEIDIMEMLGGIPKKLELHFHFKDASGQEQIVGKAVAVPDLTLDWHVYGLRWEPSGIIWYLDGKEIWRYKDKASIPAEKMYLLINLAVGGTWPGPPNAMTKMPAELLVDYVRIWQRTTQQ